MASRSTGGCPVENDPLTFLSASAARMNPPFVPKLICQSLYPKLLSKNLLTKRNALNAYVFAPIGSRWLDALIVLIAAETMDLYTPFKAPKEAVRP